MENLSALRTLSIASLEAANPSAQTFGASAVRAPLPKAAGGEAYSLEHYDEAAVLTAPEAPYRVRAVNQKVGSDFEKIFKSSFMSHARARLVSPSLSVA